MKKIVIMVLVAAGLILTGNQSKAQAKIGYISLNDLIPNMPEYKKADSSMSDFQAALNQNFEDAKKEYYEKDSILSSKDTLKYTKAQLEVKRKSLGELFVRLQGWQQQASQMYQQKQQDLLAPITKKALDVVQAVAKENGYAYIFRKDDILIVGPPADDIGPLVKKKLGLK